MSLQPTLISAVPAATARVAGAAFPKGNLSRQMRDVLGTISDDADFAPLFAQRGRPAEAPWRLALVTVMPFAEGLADRQAAEAVRARIDWKVRPRTGADRSPRGHPASTSPFSRGSAPG
jgi:transposase